MLQVDLVRRHCFPVYWNGDNRRVLRGHWFARKGGLDWLPIPETVAEQLEVAYRNKVRYMFLVNTFRYYDPGWPPETVHAFSFCWKMLMIRQ